MNKFDEIISFVDDLKPNAITFEVKFAWLTSLEQQLREHITSKYIAPEAADDELCAAPLYTDIYRRYLEAMIDDAHGEMQKYNNSAAKYNAIRNEFADYYNRTYERKPLKHKHFV